VSEKDLPNAENIKTDFEKKLNKPVGIVCAKLESEMLDLSDEDKMLFLNDI
jgi:hypothetical protein